MPSSGKIVHVTSSQDSSSFPFKDLYSYWIWIVGRFISVGKVTRYRMDGPGIECRLWARSFSSVQTDTGALPATFTIRTACLLGVKRLGSGVDHPYTFIVEVKTCRVLLVYSSSGRTCTVMGLTLPFLIRIKSNPVLLNNFPGNLQAPH